MNLDEFIEDLIKEYKEESVDIELDSWLGKDDEARIEMEHNIDNKSLSELRDHLKTLDKETLIKYVMFLAQYGTNLMKNKRKNDYIFEPVLSGRMI